MKTKKQLIFDLLLKLFFFESVFRCLYSPWPSTVFICFSLCFSIVFVYFLKDFANGEYLDLACFIISFWLEGNISSPVRYSFLSIFQNDYADIFAASLLISCCSSSSAILSSTVVISFCILCKRFSLKLTGYLMQE